MNLIGAPAERILRENEMQARKGRNFLRLNWIRVELNDWERLGPSVPHTILARCLVKKSNVLAYWVYHSRLIGVSQRLFSRRDTAVYISVLYERQRLFTQSAWRIAHSVGKFHSISDSYKREADWDIAVPGLKFTISSKNKTARTLSAVRHALCVT